MADSSVYIINGNNSSRMEKPTDWVALLENAKNGQEQAFTTLYNLCFEKIFRFILYRVSNKEIAEDLGEEVFLKAFKNINSLAKERSFEGWLYQIARNTIIDYYRSKQQVINLDDVAATLEYESAIIDTLNLESDQKLVLTFLRQLPSDQQEIIKLKFFEDLTNEEISGAINKPEGTIRVIQHRALSKLKQLADEWKTSNHEF